MVFVERLSAAGVTAVARVEGPAALVADAARGLPDGPARAEAVAARLARRGVALAQREREVGLRELLELDPAV